MIWDLQNPGNSIVSIPTGGGKSLVISEFVKQYGHPVLILQPTKEILEQNLAKLQQWTDEVGVYSASMNSREIKPITLATIQSIYKKPELFPHRVVILDEMHLLSPKSIDGMYNKFFKASGAQKIFGLSATPFRQDVFYKNNSGWSNYRATKWQKMQLEAITTVKMCNRYKGLFWSKILFVNNIVDLQKDGYLAKMKYFDMTILSHFEMKLNKSKSDFDLEDYDERMAALDKKVTDEIATIAKDHERVLVFCSTVAQAKRLSGLISGSDYIDGAMTAKNRSKTLIAFREGSKPILFNVGVLTTGYDFPGLDCVVLLRPTRSLGLYMQMLGRVMRPSEGKKFGYVYDFTGTVVSMGRLGSIRVQKLSDGWNVTTETYPGGICGQELFSYKVKRS